MKYFWVDEILSYTPVSNSDLHLDELYNSISYCELYNKNIFDDWQDAYLNSYTKEPLTIDEFIWC